MTRDDWNRIRRERRAVKKHHKQMLLLNRLVGKRFGTLTVVSRYATASVGHRAGGGTRWMCVCDCGAVTYPFGHNLTTGHTKSCGDLKHRRKR